MTLLFNAGRYYVPTTPGYTNLGKRWPGSRS